MPEALLQDKTLLQEKTLLQVNNLSRSFDAFLAIKPVDLTLQAGDRVVLAGPNGSGKSTLLLCLSGLLRPSSGEIRLEGFDLHKDEREARRRLAYVPDVPVFYPDLTAWEHLRVMALAHGVNDEFAGRARELLGEFGLWEARDLFPHAYSRGMRLKLALALAFIRPFSVLLLDEPTSALDAESTAALCEKLLALSGTQTALLLTTHDPRLAGNLNAKTWSIHDGSLTFN